MLNKTLFQQFLRFLLNTIRIDIILHVKLNKKQINFIFSVLLNVLREVKTYNKMLAF